MPLLLSFLQPGQEPSTKQIRAPVPSEKGLTLSCGHDSSDWLYVPSHLCMAVCFCTCGHACMFVSMCGRVHALMYL